MAEMTKGAVKFGEPDKPREVPVIKPSMVKVEPLSSSQDWRRAEVVLPPGIVPQDLQDYPGKLWKLVQESQSCLRRGDYIRLKAHDDSWCMPNAYVIDADSARVVISPTCNGVVQTPSRTEVWEDATHRVFFDGPARFVVARKADGVPVSTGHGSLEAAKHAYFASQPKRVA